MAIMYTYQNGNGFVSIDNTGTRIITFDGDKFVAEFPCSMDVKITNYCNLDNVCVYCHEMSNKQGKHADLDKLLELLYTLPAGVEIAIGGGNPLSHPSLFWFLERLREHEIIANLTVNELHLQTFATDILTLQHRRLIKGLGVSYRGVIDYTKVKDLFDEHTVLHVIHGLVNIDEIVKTPIKKILWLGFKNHGNGNWDTHVNTANIGITKQQLLVYVAKGYQFSFDTLAIEQMTSQFEFDTTWYNKHYQGDEGTLSMYIDAVEDKFALSSSTTRQYDIDNKSIQEMFAIVRSA